MHDFFFLTMDVSIFTLKLGGDLCGIGFPEAVSANAVSSSDVLRVPGHRAPEIQSDFTEELTTLGTEAQRAIVGASFLSEGF